MTLMPEILEEINNDKVKTDVLDAKIGSSSNQTVNDNSSLSSNKLMMIISYGKILICIVAVILTLVAAAKNA